MIAPALGEAEVHVWHTRVLGASGRSAIRRAILAAYAGCAPEEVELHAEPGHKPRLARPAHARRLEFSSSASGDLALVAIARGAAVGVDVERLRPVCEPVELAQSVLSERDRVAIASLPVAWRHKAFLERWTVVEARLKARGDGLAALGVPDARWSTRLLPLGPGYVGAVAAEGVGWRVRCRRW
jgi:4'-phosphopantetheinyl transferase